MSKSREAQQRAYAKQKAKRQAAAALKPKRVSAWRLGPTVNTKRAHEIFAQRKE